MTLVNLYDLEAEETDEDKDEQIDQISSSLMSQIRLYNTSPVRSGSLPDVKPQLEFPARNSGGLRSHSLVTATTITKSSSESDDLMTTSDVAKSRSLSRRSGLSRKGAVLGDRNKLKYSRDRVRSPSASPARNSRSSTPPSTPENNVVDYRHVRAAGVNSPTGLLPSIKVSSIPTHPPPTLTTHTASTIQNSSSESEMESKVKLVHHQNYVIPSTKSESTRVNSDVGNQAPGSELKKKVVSRLEKTKKDEEDGIAFVDEFKKVKYPPSKPPPHSGIGTTGSKGTHSAVSSGHIGDAFTKIKHIAVRRGSGDTKLMASKSLDNITDEFNRSKETPYMEVDAGPGYKKMSDSDLSGAQRPGEFENNDDNESAGAEAELFKKVHVSSSEQKPVVKARRKEISGLYSMGAPPTGLPPAGPPPSLLSPARDSSSPIISSNKKLTGLLGESRDQVSVSAAGGPALSEYSTSSMACPDEEGYTIADTTGGTAVLPVSKPLITRRNATRVSKNKRPPPRPNTTEEEKEEPKQKEDEDSGGHHKRPKVLKVRRPHRFGGAAVKDHSSPANSSPVFLKGVGDLDDSFYQRYRRQHSNSIASVDSSRDRVAMLESSTRSEGSAWNKVTRRSDGSIRSEGSISSTKSDGEASVGSWKPDGEN